MLLGLELEGTGLRTKSDLQFSISFHEVLAHIAF